ncbi:MAG TPA: HAD-IIB family hydrolase [Terriglobales bacterium]|nr:HAD-IIB family hydrolase [Terriglobales bacterium]
MRYLCFATDYDGTLASQGRVDEPTRSALERLRKSGRKLILVSGRELQDLQKVFPALDLFDYAVLENGALLYDPKTKEEKAIAEPPPRQFIKALRDRSVPISVGRSIVATWHPHETTVLKVIEELGLELHVIFNKGAVMVLPTAINKASGLAAALQALNLSEHNVVGIGDAENDHAFLSACECGIAVSNALPSLKERADIVTRASHGAGVVEIIEQLIKDDLESYSVKLQRRSVLLGSDGTGGKLSLPTFGPSVLIAGPSGSGKSTVVTAVLERLCNQKYQFLVFDPEGDYEQLLKSVTVGGVKIPPPTSEIRNLIEQHENTVINLLGVSVDDRPAHLAGLLPVIAELRSRIGRPHWTVIDEAHHLLPASWIPPENSLPEVFRSTVLVTVHPGHVSERVLGLVDTFIAVGANADQTLTEFCRAIKVKPAHLDNHTLQAGEVLYWNIASEQPPVKLHIEPAQTDRQRHRRKYAEGDIREKSFFFRGPQRKLNLRAQNLGMFLHLSEGIDDETWDFHLRQGDYSSWIREAIKDNELADLVAEVEKRQLSPQESRIRIREIISKKYTAAA